MQKKISKDAYGGVKGSQYKPYISKGEGLKEITPLVIVVGIVLAIIFAASNTYSSLTAGMTVAAGIPGAILGGGFLKIINKKTNALNINLVQGMASGGESMASGMTFVLPAIFLIGADVSFFEGLIIGIIGAFLGIVVTSLVYKYLIIDEHGSLLYPEGMAISETVVSTDSGGDGLKIMGFGGALGAIITLLSSQILGLFSASVEFVGTKFKYQWQTDANPMLVGIGFIVGMDVAVAMFAGAFLSNFAIAPLIGYITSFAAENQGAWNNPDLLLSGMTSADIYGTYTKYIGAGMMLAGGLIGAIKLIPVIKSSIQETINGASGNDGETKGATGIILIISLVLLLIIGLMISDGILMMILTILLVLLFSFLFCIVAARMTGNIGTSNLPVSGMTIASLLIITVMFVLFGTITNNPNWTNTQGNVTILLALTIVVSAIATSGGYSQSQKATFIVGGNKDTMQKFYAIATMIGVAVTVAVVIILRPVIESGAAPAPQANLMSSITNGILSGNLPWAIIFTGIFIAFVLLFLDLPIMTIAIGFYLPMGTVTAVLLGALIRAMVERANKKDDLELERKMEKGTVFSSGLIAGGAIMGLIGAFLAVFAPGGSMENYFFYAGADGLSLFNGNVFGLVMILALVVVTYVFINKSNKNK